MNSDKRAPLRSRGIAEKRDMLRNFHKDAGRQKHGPNEPGEFVDALKATDRPAAMLEIVTTLRISLTNRSVSWLIEFGTNGGLDILVALLKESQK